MKQIEIRWAGEIDLANIDGKRAELEHALDDGAVTDLVVDLSAVTFIDSSALNLLLTARRRADRQRVRLAVSNVPDRARTLFRITNTMSLLDEGEFEAADAAPAEEGYSGVSLVDWTQFSSVIRRQPCRWP